jgi:hypothetical protein
LALAGIVAVGAALRFWALGHQSFWYDEIATTGVLRPSLFGTLGALPNTESTPPLYYVLAWGWSRVTGVNEVGLRSLSALAGTATIAVAWAAGREAVSERVGLFAAAIVAVNPMLIWYSQEARAYALLALAGAISFWLFLRACRDPTPRALAAWAIACVFALLTHYFAVFLIGAEALVLFWTRRAQLHAIALALLPTALVGLALLPLAHKQEADGRTAWIAGSPIGDRLNDVLHELVSANAGLISSSSTAPGGVWAWIATAGVLVGLAGAGARLVGALRPPGLRTAWLVGALAILIPLVLAFTPLDYFKDRHLIAAWVPLAVGLAGGIALLPWPAIATAALAAIAVSGIAVSAKVHGEQALQRTDWRDAARVLGPPTVPRAVIVGPSYARVALGFYGHALVPMPLGARVEEVVTVSTDPGLDARTPAGFIPIAKRQIQQLSVLRYRTQRPLTITPAVVRLTGQPMLLETSLAGRRWLVSYLDQVRVWSRDLSRAPSDPQARRRLAGAATVPPRFVHVPEEVPSASTLLARLRAAASEAVAVSRDPSPAARARLGAALRAMLAPGSR